MIASYFIHHMLNRKFSFPKSHYRTGSAFQWLVHFHPCPAGGSARTESMNPPQDSDLAFNSTPPLRHRDLAFNPDLWPQPGSAEGLSLTHTEHRAGSERGQWASTAGRSYNDSAASLITTSDTLIHNKPDTVRRTFHDILWRITCVNWYIISFTASVQLTGQKEASIYQYAHFNKELCREWCVPTLSCPAPNTTHIVDHLAEKKQNEQDSEWRVILFFFQSWQSILSWILFDYQMKMQHDNLYVSRKLHIQLQY